MHISSVHFKNFKAFRDFSVSLQSLNVLVGPNNCGKSTIISAFRALDVAMRRARSRKAEPIRGGKNTGHVLSADALPLSIENVHTDLADDDSSVEFRLSNGVKLRLVFPRDGGCLFSAESASGYAITNPTGFKSQVPLMIAVVPILGPVEYNEPLVEEQTVLRALGTHRASRHFRNYWRLFPQQFDAFQALVSRTWPGMTIERPEHSGDYMNPTLNMVCLENRMARELYWSGFGFQVWCQLLTHVVHASDASLIVVDEPEIYLHPDVQRQFIRVLRELQSDVVVATHSTEIMAEADPTEILMIDKRKKSAKRLRDVEEVQAALDAVGSLQNITLTQLARNRRVLFMEGQSDHRIIQRISAILGYPELAAGLGITCVESGGFSSWDRIKGLAWGLEKTAGGKLHLGAVFDRDYWPDEQVMKVESELKAQLALGHILARKEIENYLLVPSVLERAIDRALRERERRAGAKSSKFDMYKALEEVTVPIKAIAQGQYIAKRLEFMRNDGRDDATLTAETIQWFEDAWATMETRLRIVPGKVVLAALRERLQSKSGATLTEAKILDSFKKDDIPQDLSKLIAELDKFRKLGVDET